jgi:branched-chain amino acid transport system substrate-binding protein
MQVGLLYASSNVHPGIGMDFLQAIKQRLALKQLTGEIMLLAENIGFGGSEKEVYEKVEKLLVQQDVDMLVAFIDLKVVPILQPLIFTSAKPVLLVNAGANFPLNWVPPSNLFHLNLQHAFLARLTGKLAAAIPGKQALVASNFYDSGYLHTAAMVKGFTDEGGSVVFNYINNSKTEAGYEISQLIQFLHEHSGNHSLLCLFDSRPAATFYDHLKRVDEAGNLSLFVSPMMLEKEALNGLEQGFPFSIQGYAPWPGFENLDEQSQSFFESGKRANIFSLLGIEVALVLEQAWHVFKNGAKQGGEMVEALCHVSVTSPRGALLMDPDTHYYCAPVYKCRIDKNEKLADWQQVKHNEIDWKEFTSEELKGVVSGWTNTYLCY